MTIVAVTLPTVRRELGFTAAGLQWVVSAYTLAFGGLLVAAGRAGDLFGRRRLFALGLALFGAASLSCGLATSPTVLVASRGVQGVGAALAAPAALALLTVAFAEPAERRRAVAWWTAAAAGGGASGWVLGGVLTEALGWRAVFLVNVPLCLVAVALIARVLEESRGPRTSLDLGGAAAVTIGLAVTVLGFTLVESRGIADPVALASLGAGAVALVGFVAVERRALHPILPPWAIRRPGFIPAAVTAAALTGVDVVGDVPRAAVPAGGDGALRARGGPLERAAERRGDRGLVPRSARSPAPSSCPRASPPWPRERSRSSRSRAPASRCPSF